ncbi:MAG: nucleotidyltransferase domain-containing protein [Myxococcota bacterium]|nr:nucleotidyltransferase domain-containing protein [Deltaproteobacteria bacterium]MDQ3335087.1 nucleotidyltransferase domain-containing protein [Myxococcota bacterium]
MTWRMPPYDAAALEIERHVRATYQIHGMVIAGSIVRGEAGPMSDLDVFIVHAEPWRLRDQRRFCGVPAELFVNPPDRIRGYFKSEHEEGRPGTAHMLTTGELLAGADEVALTLVREAHDWMVRPLEVTDAMLTSKRYMIVDGLDDARDAMPHDPAAAMLLLATCVRQTVGYAFWQRGLQQPRRKDLTRSLAAIDPAAAELLRKFATTSGDAALRIAIAFARHTLGVDSFFEWTSERS